MIQTNEKIDSMILPVVPLRGTVAFPGVPISLEIKREISHKACEKANEGDGIVLLLAQIDGAIEEPSDSDFHQVGTVAKIKQSVKTPDGDVRIILENFCRAHVTSISNVDDYFEAHVLCKTVEVKDNGGIQGEALTRQIVDTIASAGAASDGIPQFSPELLLTLGSIKNPGLLADFVGANILRKVEFKQQLLEVFHPLDRLELLMLLLKKEFEIMNIEAGIRSRVRERLDSHQEDYYLREQLKVIQEELGEDTLDEAEEYRGRIEKLDASSEIKEKLLKEVSRLAKAPFGSAEGGVLRNYLDVCLDIPWGKRTLDSDDIVAAEKILNEDHDGLEKVKERILEFLAVKKFSPDLGGQIICLVGPPGVGKTSVASSVARALGRKFVRVSLGGVRDESDIRGHRKTYVAAMPGRIIDAITSAGCENPVILLDEVDKLTRDAHGDPASALLEVLDPEQNRSFRDHFIEMPIDLSAALFIATTNTLETVPEPLIDRMEVIELHTYTRSEKLSIAKHHLIPKQLKRHGFSSKTVKITDKAIIEVIDYYTREAGVRNLEREIASLCRKSAKIIGAGELASVKITDKDIAKLLGPRRLLPENASKEASVGVVNGLAYTAAGGDMLKIESVIFSGSGKLELTGSLGDVMKESAHIALSYLRSRSEQLNIDEEKLRRSDIHIHVPEGATPKDGPSAGITMMTSLASTLTGVPVRGDTAMTGEITLTGRVLAIGGLREKTMAALSAGIKRVIIPQDNMRDMDKLDPKVIEKIEFIPVKHAGEVLENALVQPKKVEKVTPPTEPKKARAKSVRQAAIRLPAGASGK